MRKHKYSDETKFESMVFWIQDHIPFNLGYKAQRWYEDTRLYVRSWYQRRTKGYADAETWNLSFTMAEWVLPRLKHLRNNLHGVPANLEKGYDSIGHCVSPEDVEKQKPEDRYDLTIEEWESKLDKMIYAFEFVVNEDEILNKCYPEDYKWGFTTKECEDTDLAVEVVWNDKREPDYTYYKECAAKHEEGMKLFALYYRHLWD
jgi:hypothetical protein